MTYVAERCPCGHRTCKDWHVSDVAAVQGVHFTEAQARAVADLLNNMPPSVLYETTDAYVKACREVVDAYVKACIAADRWDATAPVGLSPSQQKRETKLHDAVEARRKDVEEFFRRNR